MVGPLPKKIHFYTACVVFIVFLDLFYWLAQWPILYLLTYSIWPEGMLFNHPLKFSSIFCILHGRFFFGAYALSLRLSTLMASQRLPRLRLRVSLLAGPGALCVLSINTQLNATCSRTFRCEGDARINETRQQREWHLQKRAEGLLWGILPHSFAITQNLYLAIEGTQHCPRLR